MTIVPPWEMAIKARIGRLKLLVAS
jgi:PIN domain nuclease of toxin-antitoxin system